MSDKRHKPPRWQLRKRREFEQRMENRKTNLEAMVVGILARRGLTIEDTKHMTDDQLLSLIHFGPKSLDYVRRKTGT